MVYPSLGNAPEFIPDPIPAALTSFSVSSDLVVSVGTPIAVTVGTADITASSLYGAGGSLNGLTLIVNSTTVTLSGGSNTANLAALLAAIGAAVSGVTATAAGAGSIYLQLAKSGASSTIVIGAGTANTLLGLTAGTYRSKTWAQYTNDLAASYWQRNVFISSLRTPYTNTGAAARGIWTATGGTLYADMPWTTNQAISIPAGQPFPIDIIAVYPATTFTDGVLYA